MAIPADADYGIHTARAAENFPITGILLRHYPELVQSLAMAKKAAAMANRDLGALKPDIAAAIISACDLIIAGDGLNHFVVDMLQGGAGTSTNMNANEVIANIALKLMGRPRGDYAAINPNDHVNLSQSTNDVYPTAVRLTILRNCPELIESQQALKDALLAEGGGIRRCHQGGPHPVDGCRADAAGLRVPRLCRDHRRGYRPAAANSPICCAKSILGGTAIGTGINTPEGYSAQRHPPSVGDLRTCHWCRLAI